MHQRYTYVYIVVMHSHDLAIKYLLKYLSYPCLCYDFIFTILAYGRKK